MHSAHMEGYVLFDRLLELRELNPNSLAEAIGMPTAQSGFDRFRKGEIKQPRRNERMEAAARRLGVNVLAFYDGEMADNEWARVTGSPRATNAASESSNVGSGVEESAEEFVQVRRTDVKFSNGVGRLVFAEDDGEPLMFRADFLRRMGIRPANAVVVRAIGVSNEPKITNDAVVLVNRGDCDRLDGGFFAFRVDGELLIKRLERIAGVGVLAIAENPDFKPKTRIYNGDIDFEIIGRAVWVGTIL